MSDSKKLILAGLLLAGGLTLMLSSLSGRTGKKVAGSKYSNGAGAVENADSGASLDGKSAKPATAAGALVPQLPAKKAGPPGDIDHIYQLASLDVGEAYTSYKIFVDYVLEERASSPSDLQRLIRGTIAFTDVDPGNDHYYALAEVWQKYPREFEQAVYSLNLAPSQRQEILDTVESFADVREHGNG